MKKIYFAVLSLVSLLALPLQAQEKNAEDDIKIPMSYLPIDQKCINTDVNLYNMCLKEALLKVLSENFTPEQQEELKKQINDIETQVAEAEPDFDKPQNKDLKDNPVKIKEFNAQNMNLIWKRLLIETLNSLEENQMLMQ